MARLAQRFKKGRAGSSTRIPNADGSNNCCKKGGKVSVPSEVKVANLIFKLKFVEPTHKSVQDSFGFVDFEDEVIGLNTDQSPEALHDTFLHELIHTICYVMSVKMKEGEEQMTRRLATGLCTVWKDNKKVFDWWQNLIK